MRNVQCARCGQTHASLEAKPLSNPSDGFEWFAMCPVKNEPIRLAVLPEGQGSFNRNPDRVQEGAGRFNAGLRENVAPPPPRPPEYEKES